MFGLGNGFQTSVFLRSLGIGVLFGGLYDLFRLLRALGRNTIVEVIFQDLLFASICAIGTFLFLLNDNFGQIRFYLLAGEGIGFLSFCMLPFSRFLLRLRSRRKREKNAFSEKENLSEDKKTIAK